MRPARQPVSLLLLGLALVTLAACATPAPTGALPSPTPLQRRPATGSPKAGASPIAIVANPLGRGPGASASPASVASVLRLPSDGQQIVVVDSTGGEGVWVRRSPAGEPLRVWPDGSPMLVIGEDQSAGGRVWRQVATLDGETGWAAAEYLLVADPAMLAALAPSLDALLAPHAATRPPDPNLQARVPVAEQAPPARIVVAATPTPRMLARATQRLPAGSQTQNASAGSGAAGGPTATPVPTATPLPTATPIKAPPGATTLEATDTVLTILGSERGLPIQIGSRPRDGMELLAVRVKVANRGATPYPLYRGAFRLALSDRTRAEPLAGGDTPMPYSAAVEAGGDLQATLTFEVPIGTRVDGLIWAPERDVTYSLGI